MSHFEHLWEDAEKTLDEETKTSSFRELTSFAMGILGTLEAIDGASQREGEISQETIQGLKTNAMGKLLLVLTQISSKDSINVYAALKAALDNKRISIFEERYK